MTAIGYHVLYYSPDVIFFQEITPYIHSIFKSFPWWKEYYCSPVPPEPAVNRHFCLLLNKLPLENYARLKFGTSPSGKCYLEADITPGSSSSMKPIRIATTQLECPVPPASMHLRERYLQAKHAVSKLSSADNGVLGGDMSWDDDADMPFPLPAGWCDDWVKLNAGRKSRAYDSFSVEKAGEFNGCKPPTSVMKKRSDRFVCKLKDYTLNKIELIHGGYGFGDTVYGERVRYTSYRGSCIYNEMELMPSCHLGLVLTIVPK